MFWRSMTTLGLVSALAITPALEAEADAGDFIGGAIVGGLIGHAITKDQQRKRTTTVVRRSGIPRTEYGRTTQTALNYFGFNAGVVDGQIGNGTRRAIERYQIHMGYPVNGRDFQPYQFDFLTQAYYWGVNGGQAQTGKSGRALLNHYRLQLQTGATAAAVVPQPQVVPQGQVTTVIVPAPQVVTPQPAAPAVAPQPAAPVIEAKAPEPEDTGNAIPNLFANSAPTVSLANRCNAVMLQTSTNGGYTTLASLSDADFTMSEQFCLARSYAIARGEEMMSQIQGLTPQQIGSQCETFGSSLTSQVDTLSLSTPLEAQAAMRKLALETGMSPANLASTSRVCLAVGYSRDNMNVALGAALMLVALGEPAYGELLGHHLREGVGANARQDLAMQWYEASVSALETGSPAVFMPSQAERPMLLRAAMTGLNPTEQSSIGAQPKVQNATLPTFTISD